MLGSRFPSRWTSLARIGLPDAVFRPDTTQLLEAIMRGAAVPHRILPGTIRFGSSTFRSNSTSRSPRRPGNSSSSFSWLTPAWTISTKQSLHLSLRLLERQVANHAG